MLFEDECLDFFKDFLLEDIYEWLDALLEDIDDAIFKNIALSREEALVVQEAQLRNAWKINMLLSELYRRNRLGIASWLLSPFSCFRCKQPFYKKEVYMVLGYECCYECSSEDAILADRDILSKRDETEKRWEVFFSIKAKIKNDCQTLNLVKQYMIEAVSPD